MGDLDPRDGDLRGLVGNVDEVIDTDPERDQGYERREHAAAATE